MNPSSSPSDDHIRQRAYQLWQESGRPNGQEEAHWLQAEAELRAHQEKAELAAKGRGTSVEPPPAAKHQPEHAPHSANYVHPGVTNDALHHQRMRSGQPR